MASVLLGFRGSTRDQLIQPRADAVALPRVICISVQYCLSVLTPRWTGNRKTPAQSRDLIAAGVGEESPRHIGSMFCAISGVTPEEPVVSPKSGLLFERRLIEKYIAEHGTCPVTNEPLTKEELVSIKTNQAVKPRPLEAASIPGMLRIFQNEWDALMLGESALLQQLHTVRMELSHALYQHDAACRVIARVKKERDEARNLLAQLDRRAVASAMAQEVMTNGKRAPEDIPDEVPVPAKKVKAGITSDVIQELTDCNTRLSQIRKKRQVASTLATVEAIEYYTQVASHPLHKTSKPGILSCDIYAQKDLIVTGGVDSNAVVFDHAAGRIRATLAGHSKRVTSVKFAGKEDIVLTGSADKTVRLWKLKEDSGFELRHVLSEHTGEIRAVTVHATNNYFVSASADKTWCFYDISTGTCLTQVGNPDVKEGYTSAAFHPDGLILGAGTGEALVRIWDVKSQTNVATFQGHTGAVSSVSFSENGYFLATAAQDGVKLWDLRKLKNFRSLSPYDGTIATNTVEFDFSGSYLAMAGSDIRIHQVQSVKHEWPIIKTFNDFSGTGTITSVRFGPDAKYMAITTMDKNLRIVGPPQVEG
ncbi:hypothetical protein CBR_g32473 [Chara braunii]|uniref:Pre-mRNA-processing factor 19 n=1 Tax=Chara braunii TaxID=69332 RepID=A0A388LGX9_CHABU|nr:hypothetical protein CBR_g32473 [Chara braunii]|eukprot:GBG81483.1 hypothetical protein CBR_g32473 [Chara braunii]